MTGRRGVQARRDDPGQLAGDQGELLQPTSHGVAVPPVTLAGLDHTPLTWDELVPYERDQGGYWLYHYPGCDVYGNGKIWVPVKP
jgi:hypothetical protein